MKNLSTLLREIREVDEGNLEIDVRNIPIDKKPSGDSLIFKEENILRSRVKRNTPDFVKNNLEFIRKLSFAVSIVGVFLHFGINFNGSLGIFEIIYGFFLKNVVFAVGVIMIILTILLDEDVSARVLIISDDYIIITETGRGDIESKHIPVDDLKEVEWSKYGILFIGEKSNKEIKVGRSIYLDKIQDRLIF